MSKIVKAKIDDNGAILCLSEYCNHNGDICPIFDKCEYYLVDMTKVEKDKPKSLDEVCDGKLYVNIQCC